MNWNELFEYREGYLYWKVPVGIIRAGTRIGTARGKYLAVTYKGQHFWAHRVVWEMHNGQIPDGLTVDHMDRNKHNNALENLRLATRNQQQANRTAHRDNKSKWKGVSPHRATGRWRVDFKGRYQGIFASEINAAMRYAELAYSYGDDFSYLNPLPFVFPVKEISVEHAQCICRLSN